MNPVITTSILLLVMACASPPVKEEDKYKRGPDKRYFTGDVYETISEPFVTHDTNAIL